MQNLRRKMDTPTVDLSIFSLIGWTPCRLLKPAFSKLRRMSIVFLLRVMTTFNVIDQRRHKVELVETTAMDALYR
jgi:hypothetical protein